MYEVDYIKATTYVTISLVLPYIYRLIQGSKDGMLYLPWKLAGQQWLCAEQIEPKVRAARKLFHTDLKRPGGTSGRSPDPINWLSNQLVPQSQ